MNKILATLLCVMLIVGCSDSSNNDAELMAPPIVTTIELKPQTIEVSENYPARVKAFRHAEIRPQVGGIITERLFEQGSEVTKGQALFQINDEVFQVELMDAKASLDKAEAEAMRAHNHVNRLRALASSNALTKQQLEEAEAQYKQAIADIAQAKAQLAKAELDIAYAQIKAPISGRIGQSFVSEGTLVNPNDAQPLALIQQVDKVYIDVKQPLSQIEFLEAEAREQNFQDYAESRVEILNSNGTAYDVNAKLLFTELDVNETMGDSTMRVEVDNTNNRLRPGMYVRVKVTFGEIPKGLLIPVASVSRDDLGNPQVMLINEHEEGEYRAIQIGQQLNGFYIVKSGLSANDQIVVEGHTRAEENSPITIKPWNPNLQEKYRLNETMQAQLNEIMTMIQQAE